MNIDARFVTSPTHPVKRAHGHWRGDNFAYRADAVSPGNMARLVEERGFQALLFAEHTHIQASERPLTDNGQNIPRKYWHTYDLFVAMTAAAAATSRLRVGSAICLVIEPRPDNHR